MIHEYDACLKCTVCEMHCPVLRVAPEFPGPKNGGPGLARLRAAGEVVELDHLDLCLGCRTCDTVCPSGIRPAELVNAPKVARVSRRGLPLREWVLTHTYLFGPLAVRMPGLVNGVLANGPIRWTMEKVLHIDRHKPMPKYANHSFREWFRRRRSPWQDRPAPNGRVVYFHGCSVQYMEPHIGRHVVEVLEHNGFEVVLPPQKCCGLPLIANGDLKSAAGNGRYNVQHLREWAAQGVPIVVSSTSCSLTLKHDYPGLLGLDGAGAVAEQVYDLFEFLMACHEQGLLRTDFRPIRERLPYHQPCHQRAQAIGLPAVELLNLIPGVEAWNLDAGCCGSAGTYGFKEEKYGVSMRVGQAMADGLRASGASRAVSDCETCRWQIEYQAGMQAVHPVSVLWEAYGLGDRKGT
ncbi:anaerobic glycerol-3-phosphate dehydrogenase subunit C [Symbiobacterium thermophilum]|uniref:anaerobic glycerol-3-phosphate dehydrogenase subunit C n=1 Tax=Symbiobacterium thermophilum TaxID=2734 RepID=UPI0035C68B61